MVLFGSYSPCLETVKKSLKEQNFGDRKYCKLSDGIGLVVGVEASGHKVVTRVFKGSAADRCGQIRVGDRVNEINGHDLWLLDVKQCRKLIVDSDLVVALTISRKLIPGEENNNNNNNNYNNNTSSTPSITPEGSASKGESSHNRSRSDSEISEALTTSDQLLQDEHNNQTVDKRMEFSLLLEKGGVQDCDEQFLESMYYTKGHLSFIKGKYNKASSYDRRWVAIRNGKVIVTKGKSSKITKILDLNFCEVTKLLQSTPGPNPSEYFVGIKMQGIPTLYFGDSSRQVVQKMLNHIKDSLECDTSIQESPSGYCAARMAIPEDMSSDYIALKN